MVPTAIRVAEDGNSPVAPPLIVVVMLLAAIALVSCAPEKTAPGQVTASWEIGDNWDPGPASVWGDLYDLATGREENLISSVGAGGA